MSRENVKNFYEMLKVDANLAQELMKLKEELEKGDKKFLNDEYVINEKIIPLAKKHGFDFTADEFTAYSKEQLSKLSEEELLNVTGGTGVVGAIGGVLLSIFSMFGFGANSTTSIPDTVIEGTTSTERDNTVETPNEEDSSESFKEISSSIDKVGKSLLPDFKSKLEDNKTEDIKGTEGFLNYITSNSTKAMLDNKKLLREKISDLEQEIGYLKQSSTEENINLAAWLRYQNKRIYELKQNVETNEKKLKESGEKNKNLNENNMDLKKQANDLKKEITSLKEEHEKEITSLKEEHEKEITSLKKEHEKEITSLKEEHEKEITSLKEKHEKEMDELRNDALRLIIEYHSGQLDFEKYMNSEYLKIEEENKANAYTLNSMKNKINDYDNGKKQLEEDLANLKINKENLEKEKEDFNKEKAEFNKLKEATYTSFTSSKLDEQARHLIEFLKERSFNVDINNKNLIKDIKHVVGQMKKSDKGIVYLHSQGIWKGVWGTDYYASDVSVDQEDLNKLYEFYEIFK